uniref:Uncharacterized protein n=1 Tax=Aegilops tauschii subsp. strangulata TaxID=200361 RepID=A0A453S332_AEGTS
MKRGVAVMTVMDLFNFVIDQNIADDDVDDYLEKRFSKRCWRMEIHSQMMMTYLQQSWCRRWIMRSS